MGVDECCPTLVGSVMSTVKKFGGGSGSGRGKHNSHCSSPSVIPSSPVKKHEQQQKQKASVPMNDEASSGISGPLITEPLSKSKEIPPQAEAEAEAEAEEEGIPASAAAPPAKSKSLRRRVSDVNDKASKFITSFYSQLRDSGPPSGPLSQPQQPPSSSSS